MIFNIYIYILQQPDDFGIFSYVTIKCILFLIYQMLCDSMQTLCVYAPTIVGSSYKE